MLVSHENHCNNISTEPGNHVTYLWAQTYYTQSLTKIILDKLREQNFYPKFGVHRNKPNGT